MQKNDVSPVIKSISRELCQKDPEECQDGSANDGDDAVKNKDVDDCVPPGMSFSANSLDIGHRVKDDDPRDDKKQRVRNPSQ